VNQEDKGLAGVFLIAGIRAQHAVPLRLIRESVGRQKLHKREPRQDAGAAKEE
jgi:hypothetical protein